MTNTEMAKSGQDGGIGGEPIQALMPGTTQAQTDVGTGKAVWFCQIVTADGNAPDASSGNRIALTPDTGIFLRVPPLGRIAVYDGSAGGVFTNPVQAGVTTVYVYYDSTAGTCYLTEMV